MTIVFATKRQNSSVWARGLAWIGRQPSKLDVAGSNPAESAIYLYFDKEFSVIGLSIIPG